jgi:hypothetical protein
MSRPALTALGMLAASSAIGLVATYLFSQVLLVINRWFGPGHLALALLVLLVAFAQFMHARQPPRRSGS